MIAANSALPEGNTAATDQNMASSTDQAHSAPAEHHVSFFRQSGWLMIANIVTGAMMFVPHFLNRAIKQSGEYAAFVEFLTVVMLVPTIPLQMVLAQQTAKALTTGRQREISGVLRLIWLVTTAIWLVGALVVWRFQGRILQTWGLTNASGLWVTVFVVLLSLWTPMFWGAMQGMQNFLWLGWSMMSSAVGRVSIATIAVLLLGGAAAGMMWGVLVGVILAAGIAIWQTRSLWLLRPQSFDWQSLLGQIVPLILAFLGFQIMFTADSLFVGMWFGPLDKDVYMSAGTMSRALMWFVMPLATVMFPRIVHSAAKSEKTNLATLVLIGTAALAILGDLGLSVLGPWVVKLVFPQRAMPVAALLPWYASAMVPLAVANVLLNNLLAKPASKLVLAVCVFALSLGYLGALTRFHTDLVSVPKIMGICNLVLLLVCAWFTWGKRGGGREERLSVGA